MQVGAHSGINETAPPADTRPVGLDALACAANFLRGGHMENTGKQEQGSDRNAMAEGIFTFMACIKRHYAHYYRRILVR